MMTQVQPRFGAKAFTDEKREWLADAFRHGKVMIIDTDTQNDFFCFSKKADQAAKRIGLPVPGAGERAGQGIRPNLRKLTQTLVKRLGILRIASRDTMAPNDGEFALFTEISGKHCLEGSRGWCKIPETRFPGDKQHHISINQEQDDLPTAEDLKHLNTVLVDKTAFNLDEYRPVRTQMEPVVPNTKVLKLLNLLKENGLKVVLNYGLATDYCYNGAVAAEKAQGFIPVVVYDAAKAVDAKNDDMLSTDPSGPFANHPTYGDVLSISTQELLEIAKHAVKRGG
jgi:nicotinamidase-related amidase